MGGKDRRARTGAWEIIILFFPVLMELELESSVQLLAPQLRNSTDKPQGVRTDLQERLEISNGEVWCELQPTWSRASSCQKSIMKTTSIAHGRDMQAGVGYPCEPGRMRVLQALLGCWCWYLWSLSSSVYWYH